MKGFTSNISIAPNAERPFPRQEILWGSQEGGQNRFPTFGDALIRKNSGNPIPLCAFAKAVSNAQARIWIVDEFLLKPDSEQATDRIDQILEWLPLWLVASDIRLLTKQCLSIDENELKKFHKRALDINNHAVRREKECRIDIRLHLTQRHCNFIHDRFAIIDDELWHFGGTVGGFHASVSAASRGWRATDHGAIDFFEEIWKAGDRK